MSHDTLHNGIRLPAEWPPRTMDPSSREPMPVPYLDSPPSVIPIDVGRQLFVDAFLIEKTTLKRVFHAARKYEGNPILVPETEPELQRAASTACPFDDGVAYDPETRKFLLWYVASFRWHTLQRLGTGHTAVAVSDDGLRWERPNLDILPGTNVVLPHEFPERSRDSFCPLLDYGAEDPAERFKAYLFVRHGDPGRKRRKPNENWLMTSGDGFHWEHVGRFTARGGDGTTLHYNPFRQKWVLNLKYGYDGMRGRSYIERDRFRQFLRLHEADQPAPGSSEGEVLWVGADRLDLPDPDWVVQEPTQLYMLEVVPYESIMLGLFAIHYGPHNDICSQREVSETDSDQAGLQPRWFPLASSGPGGVHRRYQAGRRLGSGVPETGGRLRHCPRSSAFLLLRVFRHVPLRAAGHLCRGQHPRRFDPPGRFRLHGCRRGNGRAGHPAAHLQGAAPVRQSGRPERRTEGRSTRPGRWRGRALFHRQMHTRERRWDLHPGPLARSRGPLGCRRYARHADAVPIPTDKRQSVCLLGHLRSRRQEPRLRRFRWARLRRPQRRVTGRSPPGP